MERKEADGETHLVEGNAARAVDVKDGHEQLDGVELKRGPVAIDEGLLQLDGVDVAAVVAVDGGEPGPVAQYARLRSV